MGRISLWSIQTQEAFQILQRDGILTGSWDHIIYPSFGESYHWMMSQMELRGISTNDNPPVWAWRKKPNKRHVKTYSKQGVILGFSVPEELVLLSSFNGWHFVLNNSYYCLTDSDEEWEKDYTPEEITSSWTRVFSPEELKKGTQQACLPYFKLDWLQQANSFTGK